MCMNVLTACVCLCTTCYSCELTCECFDPGLLQEQMVLIAVISNSLLILFVHIWIYDQAVSQLM